MRIVNRETFLNLPSGTVFMKYKPQIFDELMIKYKTTVMGDFVCSDITQTIDCESSYGRGDILFDAVDNPGKSIPLDFNSCSRDSFWDEDQLFAVYEQKDIDGLIEALSKCRGVDNLKG